MDTRKFIIEEFGLPEDVGFDKVQRLTYGEIEELLTKFDRVRREECAIPVVSGSLPLASAEFIKWLMDDKHDYVYVNGEFIEQWTNVEFTISEMYDQWSMERRQANDR